MDGFFKKEGLTVKVEHGARLGAGDPGHPERHRAALVGGLARVGDRHRQPGRAAAERRVHRAALDAGDRLRQDQGAALQAAGPRRQPHRDPVGGRHERDDARSDAGLQRHRPGQGAAPGHRLHAGDLRAHQEGPDRRVRHRRLAGAAVPRVPARLDVPQHGRLRHRRAELHHLAEGAAVQRRPDQGLHARAQGRDGADPRGQEEGLSGHAQEAALQVRLRRAQEGLGGEGLPRLQRRVVGHRRRGQAPEDRPGEVEGDLRRRGQGQGGQGRRGRHQERRQRDGLDTLGCDPGRRSHPLARPLHPLPRQPHDRARRDDRERRAAVDQRGPRLLGDLAGVGGQRLPADLWRPAAARRAAGRPPRAPPDVHLRHHAVHAQLAGVRPVDLAGDARRRARRAGRRRRRRLGGLAVADHGPLPRDGRAGEGDGVLRLRRVGRRDARRAARRGPDRLAELALDLPRQRPDRGRRVRAVPAAAAGDAGGDRVPAAASTSPAR